MVGVADASIAAGEIQGFPTRLKGTELPVFGWATAAAQPITIAFWSAHHRVGSYSGTVRIPGGSRSYGFLYTQNVADIPEYKTVTIPGDTVGTWPIANTLGMELHFSMACGSTYAASSAGVWYANEYLGVVGQINGVAATSDVFRLTGVVVLPGTEAPSAARSPLIMRPFDQELLTCRRYFWKYYGVVFGEALCHAHMQAATTAVAIVRFR